MTDDLNKAWADSRESAQALRDKEREYNAVKTEAILMAKENAQLETKANYNEAKAAKLQQLVDLKAEAVTEMEKKLREGEEMLTAWQSHVTCMQMERDSALDRLKAVTGSAVYGMA